MTNCQINKDCTDKEECIDGKCQTKSSNANGVCMIEIQNPKEQVYMYVIF